LLKAFKPGLIFKKINKKRYDIIHYHGDDYLSDGSYNRVRTFYGSALYEAIYSKKPKRFLRQCLFYIFELISCFRKGIKVGISEVTLKVLPFVKYKIPCCIPLDKFSPKSSKTPYPSILFLGDLDSRKQGRLLIKEFKEKVIKEFPDSVLTIIGPQPYKEKQIKYLGNVNQDELIKEYSKSWVYCCPSSYEGFGVPILEAMACGTPVVACKNLGSIELITNNDNGILCESGLLGLSLINVLKDYNLRLRLQKNGLSFVKKYDNNFIAEKYRELYYKIKNGN
jgi:glycosyltransferase involved in cell wall biosynthesis